MSTQKKKTSEPNVVARGVINGDASYIRPVVDKKKVRQRGPNQTSQIPLNVPFSMNVPESEYLKRVDAAVKILNEGGGAAELKAEVVELKNTVKNQEAQIKDLLKVKTDSEVVIKREAERVEKLETQLEEALKMIEDLKSKIPTEKPAKG